MKTRIGSILEQMDLSDYGELVRKALQKRLKEFDFDGIQVADVVCAPSGECVVSFTDFTGAELTVVFGVDDTDRPYAMPLLGEEDAVVIDLSALTPPVEQGGMLQLSNPIWINKSTMLTILAIGDLIGLEPVEVQPNETDAFGNVSLLGMDGTLVPPSSAYEGLGLKKKLKTNFVESYQVVGRGQGKVRLPIVRKVAKMHLSRYQAEACGKHKKNEKTAKSLKVRKPKKK